MATAKKENFFNTPWGKRSNLEKGLIIGGTALIGYKIFRWIKPATPGQGLIDLLNPWGPGAPPTLPNVDPDLYQGASKDPRPLVDKINEALSGYNVMLYPEIVNLLAKLNGAELKIAYNYWGAVYQPSEGYTLTGMLEAEWSGPSYYAPAIQALKSQMLL